MRRGLAKLLLPLHTISEAMVLLAHILILRPSKIWALAASFLETSTEMLFGGSDANAATLETTWSPTSSKPP